jgi:glyoxylase-like metal-dependent hydrolase (beta-lactamase superfamily II)
MPAEAQFRVIERGWLSSNQILFDEGEAASVVDTGYASQVDLTVALMDRALAGRRLARIVNTHLHSDHVGGNAELQRRHRARVLIPPGHAAAVAAWDADALSYAATGQECERFTYDGLLEPGSSLLLGGRAWEVLAAPGHDPHMVMLFEPLERVLISADAFWENGFGAIFPEIEGESGFAEQRAALELIRRRAPLLVIPGHGAPFTDIAAALVRADERLQALAASPSRNARQVLKVLIKFLLLQVRTIARTALIEHLSQARYVRLVHQRYFAATGFDAMIDRAVAELCAGGAAALRDDAIVNVE